VASISSDLTAEISDPITAVTSPATPQLPADLPKLIDLGGIACPAIPEAVEDTGLDAAFIRDLGLRLANSVPNFTTDWAAGQLCLPMQIVDEAFWQMKDDKLVEILGQKGPFSYQYAITGRGREHAQRLLEISGYVGPAPVSLESYTALLDWQIAQRPLVTSQAVRDTISELVMPEHSVQVAELAVSSGRSLFLFGPAGNGKTSLGRMLHNAIDEDLWIPHCINIGNNVIRILDDQSHEVVDPPADSAGKVDRRWVRIRRPMVVVGGEMTIESLDLSYSKALRFYEAPMHVKANGGTFLIDDFGRQRVDPAELLNRWIIPMEHQVDHLTLHTGQKIIMPFRLMLIVATNLSVDSVADPAFLRRMGYRLHLDKPTPEIYRKIFRNYAARFGIEVSSELLSKLLERYEREDRDLRCSEPRDLVERVRDACRLRGEDLRIDQQLLDIAWAGYFGNQ